MECSVEDIIGLLSKKSGVDSIRPDDDIFGTIGLNGDDFHEMIEGYAKKYSVDMSTYLWYFHSNEEGWGGLGQMFFTPPYMQVKRIPLSAVMLAEFANQGKWNINYPEHKLRNAKRFDLKINGILLLLFAIFLIVSLYIKYCY